MATPHSSATASDAVGVGVAKRNHQHHLSSSSMTPLLLLFPILMIPLFHLLLTSSFQKSPIPTSLLLPHYQSTSASSFGKNISSCDYTDGLWIRAPEGDPFRRYNSTCKEIFKGWNCVNGGKSNAEELIKWRWKPHQCDIPPIDALGFLHRYRNRNIGFVGDSLNRNMFVSLICTLKNAVADGSVKKWRPSGADRGFTFLEYNLTVMYHRTNLLVKYGRWNASPNGGKLESLGYKQGYRVDVDIPSRTWVDAPSFHDILVVNTGHWWWAPSKFDPIQSPMLFFENGKPILPPLSPEHGLDLALKHMILFVEKKASHSSIKFFRTQSPRHFEGGDWNEGGKCPRIQPILSRQVEQLFSLKNNGTNVETRLVNQHLFKALRGSSFQILDVTSMSEFRADAHPSIVGGKKHDDCMHWCLPGLTDTWIDLLAAKLAATQPQNTHL